MRVTRTELRLASLAACVGAFLLGVSGLTAEALFRQPSDLKWGLAVVVPIGMMLAFATQRPLRLVVAATIVTAPLGSLGALFLGVHVPGFSLVLIAAVATAVVAGPPPRAVGPLGVAGIVAGLLVAVPLFSGAATLDHVILFGTAALVAWLVGVVVSEEGGAQFVFGAVSLAALVQAAMAIYEYVTKHQINFYGAAGSTVFGAHYFFGYGTTFRPLGSFYDPNSLGNFLALAIPIELGFAAHQRRAMARWGVAVIVAVTGAALLLSLSRMSWVGAACGAGLAIVMLPSRPRWRAVGVLAPLAVVVALIASGSGSNAFSQRLNSVFHPRAASTKTAAEDISRVEDWNASLSIWRAHPIAGVGLGNDARALSERLPFQTPLAQSQSTYFQLLAEGGLFGFAALLLLVLTECRVVGAVWSAIDRTSAAALAGALLAILLGWTTDVTARYTPVACCVGTVFGASAGLWRRGRCESRAVYEDPDNLVVDAA